LIVLAEVLPVLCVCEFLARRSRAAVRRERQYRIAREAHPHTLLAVATPTWHVRILPQYARKGSACIEGDYAELVTTYPARMHGWRQERCQALHQALHVASRHGAARGPAATPRGWRRSIRGIMRARP